ncbi:tautomerase family protein [Chloroflexota bacterium]
MPVVNVNMWEGHNVDYKRKLVQNITEVFVKLGTSKEALSIIITDVPKHNWGTAGKLASEQ